MYVHNVNSIQNVNTSESAIGAIGAASANILFDFVYGDDKEKKSYQDDINATLNNMGIKTWTHSDLSNSHIAIQKSQQHLIDLIRYYEGDRYHNYEPITLPYKDAYGTWTCGFGERTSKPLSEEEAYDKLVNRLDQFAKEVRDNLDKNVGKDSYTQLPDSIKQGLIDLCYNKGLGTISTNETLIIALKNKDWSTVVRELAYVTSKKTGAPEEIDLGLCRRSLSRMILASKNLKWRESREAKNEIENFYNTAKKAFIEKKKSTKELDAIYEYFTKNKISGNPEERPSLKFLIDDTYSGKGAMYISNDIYEKQGLNESIISRAEFYNKLCEYNRFPKDGPTVKINTYWNVPIIKANSSTVKPAEKKLPKGVTEYRIDREMSFYQIVSEMLDTPSGKASKGEKIALIKTLLDSNPEKRGVGNDAEGWPNCTKVHSGDTLVLPNNIKPLNDWVKLSSEGIKPSAESSQSTSDSDNNTSSEDTSLLSMMIQSFGSENVNDIPIAKEAMGLTCREFSYKVKKGDTLWRLSNKYNIDIQTLKMYNGLPSNTINIDQVIKIPKIIYKIKKGDNLNSISKKFGLTVDIIKDLNSIDDPNKIKVDQIIEIPAYPYRVKGGDTLSKIVNKLFKNTGVTVNDLKNVNGLESDKIKTGQLLAVLFNDADYNSSDEEKKKIKESKKHIAEVDPGRNKQEYEFYRKHYRNGKVVATKYIWEPTNRKGSLSGRTIIVNAGHGYTSAGHDPGTINDKCNYTESEITYKNAIELSDRLRAQGAKVIFIQGGVNLAYNSIKEEKNADMMISLHVNSSPATNMVNDRFEVFYNKTFTSGKDLAEDIEDRIDSKHKSNPDYAKSDKAGHMVTKALGNAGNTEAPAVLVELGFINNGSFRNAVNTNPVRKEAIDAIYNAILNYEFG